MYPGQWQRVPHRDDETWHGKRRGIEYLVNVIWALSDFTAENGAPMLWPRSHFNRSSPNLSRWIGRRGDAPWLSAGVPRLHNASWRRKSQPRAADRALLQLLPRLAQAIWLPI